MFHLTVSNAGPDAASGVVVTDLLPPGTTYVSDTPSQGTYDHTTGQWTVGSLAYGATATLDITATVDNTSVTNYAQITATNADDPDSQPAENALDATHAPDQDDEGSATVTVTAAAVCSLGDTVWLDLDGDGKRDPGEPGIRNVAVSVRWAGLDGALDTVDDIVTTDTTDGSGAWSVTGLSVGKYRVSIDPTTLPAGTRTPTYDLDGAATKDRTDVTLSLNQERTDVDFGFRGSATVGDTVFNDANGNDKADPGEGMPGVKVTVTLAGPDGTVGTSDDIDRVTTTNANGIWIMRGLPPGTVRVRVAPASIPAGLINTYDPDGGNDGRSQLVLAAGTHDLTQDFGYSAPATFGDLVWIDSNGNGVADPGEPGVEGVTVTLLRDTNYDGTYDTTIGTTTTDADGNYSFDGLQFGDYRAVIDTTTAPNGAALTTPDHVDADLAPGQVSAAGDFGLAPTLLPFTGANPIWLVGAGLLLVAIGGYFARFGRRRIRTGLRPT